MARARARLAAALRALGVAVPAAAAGPRAVIERSLAAVDAERARLVRVGDALRGGLARGTGAAVLAGRLELLARVASIEARDRRRRGRGRGGALRTSAIEAAFRDLPGDLGEAQWRALAALVELLDDAALTARLGDDARAAFVPLEARFDHASWRRLVDELVGQAHGAVVRHDPPAGRRGRVLATRWVNLAASLDRVSMHVAATDLLARAARLDPRLEQAWTLIATVRAWAGPPPHLVGFRWLIDATRAHLATFSRG